MLVVNGMTPRAAYEGFWKTSTEALNRRAQHGQLPP